MPHSVIDWRIDEQVVIDLEKPVSRTRSNNNWPSSRVMPFFGSSVATKLEVMA